MEIRAKGEVVVQELEQGVRLLLLQTNNVAGDCAALAMSEVVRLRT